MEKILKNPVEVEGGDLVPFNTSSKDLRDEVNSRTHKAGYTNRYGEPTYSTRIMATVKFGKVKYNIWPRDKNGNLIE